MDHEAPQDQQVRVVTARVPWGYFNRWEAVRHAGDAADSLDEANGKGSAHSFYLGNHYGLLAKHQRGGGAVFYRAVFAEVQ